MKIKKDPTQLPKLKGYIGNMSQRTDGEALMGVPRKETSKFLKNKQNSIETVKFKLPELQKESTYSHPTSYFTSRHISAKRMAPSTLNVSKEKLTKESMYYGTMGKVKKNFKKHMASLEKMYGQRSPTLKSLRSEMTDLPNIHKVNTEESEELAMPIKQQISIDIEKVKESFKNNAQLQI